MRFWDSISTFFLWVWHSWPPQLFGIDVGHLFGFLLSETCKLADLQTCMLFCIVLLHTASYRKSLLRAATKTLEEGRYSFVIVDAPNVKLEEYKDFWVLGQVREWTARVWYQVHDLRSRVSFTQFRLGNMSCVILT